MKELYEKKGQAAGAVGAIVTLIVGVGVAVLVLIFVGTLGGQTYNLVQEDISGLSGSVVSQNITGSLTTFDLGKTGIDSTTFAVQNGTTNLPASNFSLDAAAGEFTLLDSSFVGDTLNASYDFGNENIESAIKSSITSGFTALEQTGDYLPLIVLAVVIALVLVIVLGFTAFGKFGEGKGLSAL